MTGVCFAPKRESWKICTGTGRSGKLALACPHALRVPVGCHYTNYLWTLWGVALEPPDNVFVYATTGRYDEWHYSHQTKTCVRYYRTL
ncbi:hypothetical protein J6590_043217 [Homalodisca vitripennis]|nr:hypothetical protein J6590_043217 [Homalodisca vitripennis]